MDEHLPHLLEIQATDQMRRAARSLVWARVRRAIASGVPAEDIAQVLGLSRATLYRRMHSELDADD